MIIVITDNNQAVDAFYSPEPNTYCEKVVKIDKNSPIAKAFMMRGELENAETVS